MKKYVRYSLPVVVALHMAALAAVVGCVASNPAAKQDAATGQFSAPPFIESPRLAAASNTVQQLANAAAPANPYAGLTDFALKAAFGLAGGITASVLTARNKGKVISAMADGISVAGAKSAVLSHTASTPHAEAVRTALSASPYSPTPRAASQAVS